MQRLNHRSNSSNANVCTVARKVAGDGDDAGKGRKGSFEAETGGGGAYVIKSKSSRNSVSKSRRRRSSTIPSTLSPSVAIHARRRTRKFQIALTRSQCSFSHSSAATCATQRSQWHKCRIHNSKQLTAHWCTIDVLVAPVVAPVVAMAHAGNSSVAVAHDVK